MVSSRITKLDEHDWKIWDATVIPTVRRLHDENKYLAIISNQMGVAKGKTTVEEVQRKVDAIIAEIGVPLDFICAIEEGGRFRKPLTGMWDFLKQIRFPTEVVDLSRCVYVGDAAGRPKVGNTRKKDHSDTDLKFALNLGVKFETPEKLFLKSSQQLHCTIPTPLGVRLVQVPSGRTLSPDLMIVPSQRSPPDELLELVLLVAPPACGKSTFCRVLEEGGYKSVNQDTLGSVNHCLQAAKTYVEEGYSVCVDNTNIDRATRKRWLTLADELNVKVRCVVLNTPKDVCMALAAFRMVDPMTAAHDRRKIEKVVIHTKYKYLEIPEKDDGYSRVDHVDWNPTIPTSCAQSARLFGMYLL